MNSEEIRVMERKIFFSLMAISVLFLFGLVGITSAVSMEEIKHPISGYSINNNYITISSNEQTFYFWNPPVGDIAGYEGLQSIPSGGAEADESVTVKNTLGNVLLDPYITLSGVPGITNIPAGLWRFRTYHYVDNSVGTTTINFSVFNRTTGGTETRLFSVSSEDINALSATEYLTSYVQPSNITIATTDRLVVKIYATTTHNANRNAHFVYQGSVHTSHVVTPLSYIGGELPHSALSGLSNDDHAQYINKDGRAGGQTLIGSTTLGENLTLQGNSMGDGNIIIEKGWGLNFIPYEDTAGPLYGTSIGGINYRTPTESMIKNFFLFRGGQYVFEDDTATWLMSLTRAGMNIGTTNTSHTPASKLEVEGNVAIGSKFVLLPAPANGLTVQGIAEIGESTNTAVSARLPLNISSGYSSAVSGMKIIGTNFPSIQLSQSDSSAQAYIILDKIGGGGGYGGRAKSLLFYTSNGIQLSPSYTPALTANTDGVIQFNRLGQGICTLSSTGNVSSQSYLAGTKTYYVSDTSGGATTRKLTFINGILTGET